MNPSDSVEKLNLRSIRDLAFRLGVSVQSIRTIAGQAGRYYRPFPIRRGNKERRIDNPLGPLRELQDRLQKRLLGPLHLPNYLHGGVRGRSAKTNAATHLGQKVIIKADVGSCFPSITHHHVFAVWRDTLGCTPTISRLLTQLTTFEGHLPQGAPTSTTLANLVLHGAGAEVRHACLDLSLTHSTFIDDLTFGGDRAREVLNPAVLVLRRAGFRLPHRKTKIMGPGDRKEVTGIVLGSKLTVPREIKSKARAALHRLSVSLPGSDEWGTALRSAQGLIAHIGHIDERAARHFKRSLEQAKQAGGLPSRLVS